LNKRNAASNGEYLLELNDQNIRITLFNNGDLNAFIRTATDNNPITAGNWHLIVATYDGSGVAGGLNIYINAVLQTGAFHDTVGTYTKMANGTLNLNIGHHQGTSGFYSGSFDDIGIRSVVTTKREIEALYNGGNGGSPFRGDLPAVKSDSGMMEFFLNN